MIWLKNTDRNQTQKGTHPQLGDTKDAIIKIFPSKTEHEICLVEDLSGKLIVMVAVQSQLQCYGHGEEMWNTAQTVMIPTVSTEIYPGIKYMEYY